MEQTSNYKSDIIATINSEISSYIKRNKAIPSRISLSQKEFDAFKQANPCGKVHATFKGKDYSVIVGVSY